MKYCTECGKPLTGKQTFCTVCGEHQPIDQKAVPPTASQKPKALSRKTKISILSLISITLCLICCHLYLSSTTSSDKVIEEFEKAVNDKDINSLTKLMNNGQNKHTATKEEAESFLAYLTEANHFPEVSKELKKQAYLLKKDKDSSAVDDAYGNKLVQLTKENKKKWFFYQNYTVAFFPIEIVVSTNLDNTTISLNGEEITTLLEGDSPSKIGYLFPGEQTISADFEGAYAQLTNEDTLDFSDAEDNSLQYHAAIEGDSVILYSNDNNAILFVNGKSTGKKIIDIDQFGPVPTDGSLKVHAERKRNNKMEKTKDQTITDSSVIDFIFEEDQADRTTADYQKLIQEDDIARFMKVYLFSQVSAINSRDFTVAAETIDPDGEAYEETRNYIKYLDEKGIYEDLNDMKVIDYEKIDKGYNITTKESYTIHYDDGSSKDKDFKSTFFVTLSEKGLLVHTLVDSKEL